MKTLEKNWISPVAQDVEQQKGHRRTDNTPAPEKAASISLQPSEVTRDGEGPAREDLSREDSSPTREEATS